MSRIRYQSGHTTTTEYKRVLLTDKVQEMKSIMYSDVGGYNQVKSIYIQNQPRLDPNRGVYLAKN